MNVTEAERARAAERMAAARRVHVVPGPATMDPDRGPDPRGRLVKCSGEWQDGRQITKGCGAAVGQVCSHPSRHVANFVHPSRLANQEEFLRSRGIAHTPRRG